MLSRVEQIRFLNDRIVVRHAELARFVSTLSAESKRIERRGRTLKVATIILGSLSVSQGIAVGIFGKASAATSVVFAVIGIAVAAIAGIDAAFKFDARASELRMLAAKCQSARFQHNSEWAYRIAIAEPEEALAAARDLLAVQDRTLSEVQLEAAKLGVNTANAMNAGRRGIEEEYMPEDSPNDRDSPLLWLDDNLRKPGSDLPPPRAWRTPSRSDEG